MAIIQKAGFGSTLIGDGVSTTVDVDTRKQLASFNHDPAASYPGFPANNYPTGVVAFSGTNVTGTTLSGSVVTYTFSSAPANGASVSVSVTLSF